MVEIDIDFDYCGEVEMVLAHDECGEHDDVEFYRNDLLAADNAKLRDLIYDILVDEEHGNTEENTFYEHVRLAKALGIETGIKVPA